MTVYMKGMNGKMDNRPIGMFDSGVGGLTVYKEVRKKFPNENIVYLGDTKSFPYGSKSKESIINLDYKDNYSVFELYKIESDISPDIKDNKITLNISGKARIKEFHSNTNITKSKETDRLNKELNKHIEDIIKKNFNSMREKYNTDIFSFRQSFYRENPKYYNTHYKDTWYESIFPNLTLEVKSNIKLYEKGNTLGGIEYENKNN